ncbi:hypothetical protein L2E82_35731 [Cichorium intybus]|uniref:Uncharacterized protein n=1 Tax=Cichorium intybus TaxID=13427 RepID=A0ACB9BPQ2_CICIN|nr:hypothetical protein L2E82_35731 [Cichorium intybus]
MESDLPLMELAEEDDFLIQPFPDPNQTPSKSSFNYFTCSPLALPPSRTKSLKDSVHIEKPSSSSTESSNNKENINSNNVELPKLAMGPIQMKRKKKGGDYNLRKSLAWDRAFFTDEGILDPRELNLITGINSYTCGRGLPSISEEGSSNSSFSSSSKCRNEPNDMKASKEALLKELYDKNRTPKGNKVGNHDSLPHHKGSMTSRNNLIPKPPINVQKNVGLKSSIKDTHGSQIKAKTGSCSLNLPDKELAQKTVRNLTHSSSKAISSTKSQLAHVEKANKDESTPLTAKNLAQLTPTTNNNSLPSGLRLPSPSLRFFDQTTTSESVSLHQKRIQQNGDIRPPLTPRTPLSNSLSPSSNYMGTKGVSNSDLYQDIVRKMQYECRGTDVDSDKVIKQEKKVLGHEGKMGIEKIALKGSEEIKESETKDEFELHNEEEKSTSGESSQHQEPNILIKKSNNIKSQGKSLVKVKHPQNAVTISDEWLAAIEASGEDLAQSLGEQADTNKSNASKSQRGKIGKIQDDVGATPAESSSLEENKCGIVSEINDNFFKEKESVLQVAQCASIYPQNLKEEGLDKEAAIIQQPSTSLKATSTTLCSDIPQIHPPSGIEDPGEDLAQTSRAQTDTEISNSSNFTPESHLDSLEAEDRVSEVFVESQRGKIGKREDSESLLTEEVEEGKNKDTTVLIKKSNTIKRQEDKSLVIHPPNAVPFSDEWLAAIEAAGEEILTMKRGAVQHSPPDKSIPERNPWSPVKNKANQIGPYDCTKYMNAMSSNHDSSDQ